MRIFHGSEVIIKKPSLELGKINNDFGRGFYCTDDIEKAKEWACKNNKSGIANIYELDIEKLRILDLTKDNYNVLNWISILLSNRTFSIDNQLSLKAKEYLIKNYYIDIKNYDVVIGYRADDSYFSYAQSFINNSLSLETLEKAMKLGNLGKQIVLVSNKAFRKIKYIDNLVVDRNEYYVKYKVNDLSARQKYKNMKSSENETYMIDIIRRGVGNGSI